MLGTVQTFEYGVYSLINGAFSTGTFEYGVYDMVLVRSTRPPQIVLNPSPSGGKRSPQQPVFTFDSPPELDGEALHFKLEISTVDTFSTVMHTFDTRDSQAGWQYSTDDGETWQPFPAGGVVSASTFKVRFTLPVTLALGIYYWRVYGFDGVDYGSYTINTLVVGNEICVRSNPIETTDYARYIVPVVEAVLPTDGDVPADVQVFACNNAFDASPTWEDATAAWLGGRSHVFANTVKTAADWGIAMRVVVRANDSTGPVELRGFGFTFS